jgi:hypothetical protein
VWRPKSFGYRNKVVFIYIRTLLDTIHFKTVMTILQKFQEFWTVSNRPEITKNRLVISWRFQTVKENVSLIRVMDSLAGSDVGLTVSVGSNWICQTHAHTPYRRRFDRSGRKPTLYSREIPSSRSRRPSKSRRPSLIAGWREEEDRERERERERERALRERELLF